MGRSGGLWTGFIATAALGAGLASFGAALFFNGSGDTRSYGRIWIAAGMALVALGVLGVVGVAMGRFAWWLYYRKPRLPKGWELVSKPYGSPRGKGDHQLNVDLEWRGVPPLQPGRLTFRCDRALIKGRFSMPWKAPNAVIARSLDAKVGNDGIAEVPVAGVGSEASFRVQGQLLSDGPLKLLKVRYSPDSTIHATN